MKHKMIVFALLLVISTGVILLTSCTTPPSPKACTAVVTVDVLDSIPNVNNQAQIVDWLSEGETTIVTARIDGWYEVVTPKFVTGYVPVYLCKGK